MSIDVCSAPGCDRDDFHGRSGMCKKHYKRWWCGFSRGLGCVVLECENPHHKEHEE